MRSPVDKYHHIDQPKIRNNTHFTWSRPLPPTTGAIDSETTYRMSYELRVYGNTPLAPFAR